MKPSYLKTLQRAYDRPGMPRDEASRARSPFNTRTFTTNEDKVTHLGNARIVMEKDQSVTLADCTKSFGLPDGAMAGFTNWLAAGKLPEASKELVEFFEMRRATQHIRAAKASIAAVARNSGRRKRNA